MKEQLLDHIHQALAIQLNELTTYYEQQITKLKRQNGALLTKVHKLEKQLATLQSAEAVGPNRLAPKAKASTSAIEPKTNNLVKHQVTLAKKTAVPERKAETSVKQQSTATNKPIALTAAQLKKPAAQEPPNDTPKPTPKQLSKATKSKHAFSLHNFHIIQEADLKLFRDEYDLEEREISVALFDIEGVEETDQTAQLRAYVNRSQTEAFIFEKAFKAEQAKHKPYRLLGSRKHYTLDWATDHILQKEGSLKRYLNFGPNSELEDFGYQVRTLKKEERWSILQNAVPIIGLKKVTDTIKNHINVRKSAENGEQFYANAISKWQYDLAQLKKHYFK